MDNPLAKARPIRVDFAEGLFRHSPQVLKQRLTEVKPDEFECFWLWKVGVENGARHILDDVHLPETHRQLCKILSKWKAHRANIRLNWRQ